MASSMDRRWLRWVTCTTPLNTCPLPTIPSCWRRRSPVELPSAVVFSIDPEIADTEALCEAFGEGPETCANCVIVRGKRGDIEKYVACLVLATTRVDVNKVVRKKLDVRKASFAPIDEAVGMSGMEYGGITPVGLPAEWPIWIDPRVAEAEAVCIGSGLRSSKLIVSGGDVLSLPGAEVVAGLAN